MDSTNITSPPSPWLTPEQAAAYLGVALGTIRNWVSMKYVPHVKRGRVVRFHREKLDAWLRRGECNGRLKHADTLPAKNDPTFQKGCAEASPKPSYKA